MSTPGNIHPSAFIQKVMSSHRYKVEVSVEQLETVIKNSKLLIKMNERGLFMAIIAELIYHQYRLFLVKIRSLHSQVCPLPKALRKKRQAGDGNPPKRRRKARVNVDNIDIQQIASNSISNPSHLQAEREQQQPNEQNKDESKGSKPNSNELNIDLNAQMEKVGEVSLDPLIQDTDIQVHNDSSQNSSHSNSSKANSNMISNISEKLRIIGGDVSFEGRRTVPRRRGPNNTSATIKRKDAKIDMNTTMDQTKPKIDLRNLQDRVKQQSKVLDVSKEDEDIRNVVETMTNLINRALFNESTLQKLRQIQRYNRRGDRQEIGGTYEPIMDVDAGTTLFQTEFTGFSQISANQEESNFAISIHEHIDSTIFNGESKVSLTNLKRRLHKPKEEIFRKLLGMAQQGQVKLQQESPQYFGQITVQLL